MSHHTTCDFLVVGAGVIGICIARTLRRRFGGRILVLEKEAQAGWHASGRNSGVLHAGVYYKAGTLKARLCVEGNRRLRDYCRSQDIPLNDYGKVIVARTPNDVPSLLDLHARAQGNQVRAELVDERGLREIEPSARTVTHALYVKDTAVVDPENVMRAMMKDAVREGVEVRCGTSWLETAGEDTVRTSDGTVSFGHFVNCGGLFADRVAHAFGVGLQYRILPFRGQFFRLRPESRVQVRGNIYPVPDLRNPFLGVHYTRRPDGTVTVGPSALPLLGREQYRGWRGANIRDTATMTTFLLRLFGRNRDHFRSLALKELMKMTRGGFFREADGLGVGLQKGDLLPGKEPGIRAQLVDTRTAELLNDFVVERGPRSTHVLNAVSPAFTSSLPFSEYVVDLMKS
jgi:L-2-hydroxyglutarate oxidase LhgO